MRAREKICRVNICKIRSILGAVDFIIIIKKMESELPPRSMLRAVSLLILMETLRISTHFAGETLTQNYLLTLMYRGRSIQDVFFAVEL
jgi:hypothetical protein